MGDKDEIVPLQSVVDWFDTVPLSSDNGGKMLTVLKGDGHDFFHERLKGNKKKKTAFDHLFEYLNMRAKKDFEWVITNTEEDAEVNPIIIVQT